MNQRVLVFLLVSMAVGLNLASAVVLKEAADMRDTPLLVISTLVFLVILINLLRVAFWSAIHKRFRLSDSYPLTSMFFPMILMLSALYGEEIEITKLIGTVFITLGVLMLMSSEEKKKTAVERVRDTP